MVGMVNSSAQDVLANFCKCEKNMEHLKMKLNSLLGKKNRQQMEDFVKLHQAKTYLGGVFNYVLFSPLLGEDSHFD